MTGEGAILAYGDSLTWGFRAERDCRHPPEARWPVVAARVLGREVVADGLSGRTTVKDEWSAPTDRNGARTLPNALEIHTPLAHVVLFLGANDLAWFPGATADFAAGGMARLVQIARGFPYRFGAPPPAITLVAPPPMRAVPDGPTEHMAAQSARLAGLYAALAREEGCGFVDAGACAEVSPLDGVHLDAAASVRVGEAIAEALCGGGPAARWGHAAFTSPGA